MKISTEFASSASRHKPLAACCAVIFALAAPEAIASNTWHVTACADSGPGSLRSLVGDPAVLSGDTVDFTLLPLMCSNISLHTGAIVINQASLVLQGLPGGGPAITNYSVTNDSLINHQGTGTLAINDMAFSNGGPGHPLANGTSRAGGCIYSAGSVNFARSYVGNCQAQPVNGNGIASGGGIYAAHNLTVSYSTIRGNHVRSTASAIGVFGGGVFAHGNLTMNYSTVTGNGAVSPGVAIAGGVLAMGIVTINGSTISNNYTTGSAYGGGLNNGFVGGLGIFPASLGSSATITNSTISGNTSPSSAGMYSRGSAVIRSSTIAFNRNTARALPGYSPGLSVSASTGSITVNLQSSLIANNTYVSSNAPFDSDVGIVPTTNSYTVALTGANNLVRGVSAAVRAQLPQDTIIGACPLLGPLRDNGGTTQTHALLSGSPGIDLGNNAGNLNYDQRSGPTPPPIAQPPVGYPRVSGIGADIGAYEVQQADTIFNGAFEGCP